MLQENLIMLRSLAGKTQEDIAEVIGISRQAYAKWERGETIPDIEKCGRLAEFYGVTMDSLIKDDVQLEGQKMAPAPKGKHMWGVVTVNDRGQIVIPKEARRNVEPANAEKYTDRSIEFPHKIDHDDLCYNVFAEHGFEWGGDWEHAKDYQHFEMSDEWIEKSSCRKMQHNTKVCT